MKVKHANPQYFSTFQTDNKMPSINNKSLEGDYNKFSLFNNFAYQNLPNQSPNSMFKGGNMRLNQKKEFMH
jgi:hypothetical protein